MKNRKRLITVIALVLIIAAALSYVVFRPKDETAGSAENASPSTQTTQDTGDKPQQSDTSPDTPASSAETEAGKYVDYSATSFAAANGARRVIFFHAPWCPQCRALEKSIKEGTVPSGWVVLKADYDTSNMLKQKYGVTLQTTLVEVDSNGNLKKKFVAYDEPSLQAVVKALGK